MKTWWLKKILTGIAFIVVIGSILSLVVMALWNALIPELFNGPQLTFWQSLGLLVLAHILLHGHGPWRHTHSFRHERWRKHFEQRMASMSPEERQKFKERFQHRCGYSFDEKFRSEKETSEKTE